MVSAGEFKQAFLKMRDVFDEQKGFLCELDGALGDGDHGLSMARGFRSAADRLESVEPADVGELCRVVGTSLTGSIGGVTGPIFGTVFLRWGMKAAGKEEVATSDLAAMFAASLEGVQAIGKAKVGEKTMVDALAPAAEAMQAAAEDGLSTRDALARAARAAREGAERTKDMKATKGRARYQGEKSIGHQDAGATSLALIVETLAAVHRADDPDGHTGGVADGGGA